MTLPQEFKLSPAIFLETLTRKRLETKCPRMQFDSHSRISRRLGMIFLLAMSQGVIPAKGVIFYSSGDPNYNTTAPSGSLTNSGWQYEGFWGGFLGTPIAPKYFITAEHVGGQVGNPFVFRGVAYPTTAVHDDPDSDL